MMDIYITGVLVYGVSLLSGVLREQNRTGYIKSFRKGLFILCMLVAGSLLWPVSMVYTFYGIYRDWRHCRRAKKMLNDFWKDICDGI